MERAVRAYLPWRITGGSCEPDGLKFTGMGKSGFIPWNKFQLLCLGLIEESEIEAPVSLYVQIKEAIENFFQQSKEDKKKGQRQIFYVDLFVLNEEQPYRLESTFLNYREFLGDNQMEHVSNNNFKQLLQKFVQMAPDCIVDESIQVFLAGSRLNIRRFGSIYEFQRECREHWQRLKKER